MLKRFSSLSQVTNKAVAIGFGISTPDHVRQVRIHFAGQENSPGITSISLFVNFDKLIELYNLVQIAEWGADAVIVGSAMVKQLGEAVSPREGLKRLEDFARSLKDALQ